MFPFLRRVIKFLPRIQSRLVPGETNPEYGTSFDYNTAEYSTSRIAFPILFRRETSLVVDRPGVFASRTFVKYCLPFVDTSQLDGIISEFGRSAFDAGFLDRCPRGLFVSCQSLLLRVCFGPQWCRTVGRIRHRRRNLGMIEFVEVGRVRADVARNRTRAVDFQRGPTRRTKWPRHILF